MSIHRGDFVSIMGESGSGKSTLLNIMGLLDRPTTGTVVVGGHSISSLPDSQLSRRRGGSIGFVFQSFHLLDSRNSLENVMLGMAYSALSEAVKKERARYALHRVGLDHRVSAFPVTMSGGERQRVAIARAVATDARIILADEPTGNLDAASSERILALMEDLNTEGIAWVVVTHSESVAARASRRLCVVDGRLLQHDDVV
ncbi:MAG: ABC transporter ATP-binding protein [Propioniciclava sp.]